MNIELVRSFFLWSTIINAAVLWVWFAFFAVTGGGMHRFHGRWFKLTPEQFHAVHYGGMAVYKIGIILFNAVPYIVLLIIA